MKFASSVIFLFLGVEAFKLQNSVRKSPFIIPDGNRVIGGQEAIPHAYPFMARLTVFWRNGDIGLCGGSLISKEWVLTAGHCVYNLEKEMLWDSVTVTLGDHNQNEEEPEEQEIEASKVIINNNYVYYGTHDIALIKLSSPAEETNAVQPGCLTPSGMEYVGEIAKAIGWGLTSTTAQEGSPVLKETELPIIPESECEAPNYDDSTMICTGFVRDFGTDTIFSGDSGGPLFVTDKKTDKRTIIGVASYVALYGDFPPQTVAAAVFTKVAAHVKWIQKNTGSDDLCISS